MNSWPGRAVGMFMLAFLVLSSGIGFAEETTENLIRDGGIEDWQSIPPGNDYFWVNCKAIEFDRDAKGGIPIAKILSQFYECKMFKPETKDVHSGQKALRLKGQFYLAPGLPDAYSTKDGDVYVVRYWAKGAGQTMMYLHVYGDAGAQIIAVKGKVETDRWSLIEERILVAGRAPTTIYPRLSNSEEILIDDVFVGRVLRPNERRQTPVPADCQERVAFAWDTPDPIVVDGKLDEPVWVKAVKFGGFRDYQDQTLLARSSPCFQVLRDSTALYFGLEVPRGDCARVRQELQGQPLTDSAGKPLPTADTYTSRESIELFIQPPGRSRYVQMVASLDGYRYDGVGMDGTWNGTWESAVTVADDRWFLEVKVPARDLGIEQIAPAEGWRLNVCSSRPGQVVTWAAVGGNFHHPDGFGRLIAQDFSAWRQERPLRRAEAKAATLRQAEALGRTYAERLAVIEAFAEKTSAGEAPLTDWAAITRAYATIGYVDYAYRCLAEEVRYLGFLQ